MTVSVFDLFKPGVGPSSSHTMGPMTAAVRFVGLLRDRGLLASVTGVRIRFYASLALTGRGHATDRATLQGLMGFEPATLDPDAGEAALAVLRETGAMTLGGDGPTIAFDEATDIVWAGRERLPQHPNAMTLTALAGEAVLAERTYFSVGGGFVRDEDEIFRNTGDEEGPPVPFPYGSGAELLEMTAAAGVTIAQAMMANEKVRRTEAEVIAGLETIHAAMEACIDRGMRIDGVLPGGLSVKRRARQVHQTIMAKVEKSISDPLAALDFVNLWALAVNEENAAGGRVVTAPTNGAAGLVPAVLRFYDRFYQGTAEGRRTFLLTAAAIGALYKKNASIGMEHNLGLTCDPIGGLVQIPCIERNAMGAIKAIDAARLALLGDGEHSVSLDKVIATMKRTGEDMNEIYKETSLGGLAVGLAVNRVEC
jgi:L-serine dehydratase